MSNLYEVIHSLCTEKGISGYRMCKDTGVQPSILTDLKMGRRTTVKAETALKIANYFGVSVDYLLGKADEKEKAPAKRQEPTEDEIKVALFGGDGEVTDAMWEEAKWFIESIKERERKKKESL